MASDENSHTQSISPLATDTSSVVKLTELDTPVPPSSSTIVLITSNSSQSIPSISSLKKNSTAYNHSSLPYVSIRNKKEVKEISAHLRRRLCIRQRFVARLTLVSNLMSFLAILGIILMIIENELTFNRVDNQDTKASWFIKLIITITTVILVMLIFYYHYLDMTLYAYRNALEDWRVQLTPAEILTIAVEILICAIHPMPRAYPQTDPEKINSTSLNPYPLSYTAVDVGLGLPMFLRLYLLGRSLLIHSDLVLNLTLRSLGYLNHVSVNVFYLMKAYFKLWPTRCMLICCTITFFIGSWSLRACDYEPTGEHLSLSDAMWLFIVTFTTIGYGDLYPTTNCARSVATIIGFVGLIASALLIALLTQKLHFTREESYVHMFVLETKLAKKCKHQAANVIKFGIKVWYLKRKNKSSSFSYFQTQQKLFQSIQIFQEIKQKQRRLIDSCVSFTELINGQRKTKAHIEGATEQIVDVKTKIKRMEKKLNNMSDNMDILHHKLDLLLNKGTK